MKKFKYGKEIFALFLSIIFLLYNCSNDDSYTETEQNNFTTHLLYPEGIKNDAKGNFTLLLKEKNSGTEYKFENETEKSITKHIISGNYQINIEGYVVVENDTLNVYGLIENIQINTTNNNLTIPLYLKNINKDGDFVIQEVFFTGTIYPTGKKYDSGKYFKIYNNSNRTLYADGLLICLSEFNPWTKRNVTPNIFNSSFPVSAILMLPGKGKDYPVEPGKSIVVCDNAINHKTTNPNAYNLTPAAVIGKAGTQYLFEFPNTDNPKLGEVDNPEVPNAKVIFTTMKLNTVYLHNRGAETYAIARLGENISLTEYLNQYKYDYSYLNEAGNISKRSVYKIPNEWIADAANVSTPGKHNWLVISPSIDRGWTYCSLNDKDITRFDTCIKRKIKEKNANGIDILQDTNNSTEDFIPRAKLFLK